MPEIGPLTGEPLALDLVNTRARLAEGPVDFLATMRGLQHWLGCERHRLSTLAPRAIARPTQAARSAVLDLREHAAAAIEHARHGDPASEHDLRGLNGAMSAAPVIMELTRSEGALRVVPRRHGDPNLHVAAELAESTAALLADPAVATVRQCEAEVCAMLFLPAHPRRRWCSPTICGNRVRVGRYHQRRRQDPSGTDAEHT